MALIVDVRINQEKILTYFAVNVSKDYGRPYGRGLQIYKTQDYSIIYHKFEDGAVDLAKSLIKHTKPIEAIKRVITKKV